MPCELRDYSGVYEGEYLNRVAFPLGGIGAHHDIHGHLDIL